MILSIILDIAWFQITNLRLNIIRSLVSVYRKQCLFIDSNILAEPVHDLLEFDNLPNLLLLLHELRHWWLGISWLLGIGIHHILRVMQGYEVVQRGAVAFLPIDSWRWVYQLQQLVCCFFCGSDARYRREFHLNVLHSANNRLKFVVFYT